MCASLQYLSFPQYNHAVGIFDGGEPVSDDYAGFILHQRLHGLL